MGRFFSALLMVVVCGVGCDETRNTSSSSGYSPAASRSSDRHEQMAQELAKQMNDPNSDLNRRWPIIRLNPDTARPGTVPGAEVSSLR